MMKLLSWGVRRRATVIKNNFYSEEGRRPLDKLTYILVFIFSIRMLEQWRHGVKWA